jgi:predicted CoA-binding protein
MTAHKSSLQAIQEFLAQKRIAMVGVSRSPKDFSAMLFEDLCRRGYDMVAVNPAAPTVLGRPSYARVQDIQPAVQGALLMTSAAATPAVVADCAEAGIRRIWMYRAAGQGAVDEKAVASCREQGIQVIPGECPYMFLTPSAGFVHSAHGFLLKLTGNYPRVA